MIRFGSDVCGDLEAAASREWLEINGLGGYASSTIPGLNTRRYHGLLVAAAQPPVGRYVLLSKLEETLVINGDRFELAANRYPGVVYPQGFKLLQEFRLDPFPVFTYSVSGVTIEKSVFMVQGENTTVVQYRAAGLRDVVTLELRPLIAFRDYHATAHENGAIDGRVSLSEGLASVTPYAGLPTLYLAHNAGQVEQAGDWYRNFEYEEERRRGLDFREDLFHPMTLKFDLGKVPDALVIASSESGPHRVEQAAAFEQGERERRSELAATSPLKDEFVEALAAAADQFIAQRGPSGRNPMKTIVAGYHWFSDWGRDTMISLPGLTLVTGKFETAREILLAFAKYVDRGMLPNVFPDAGEIPQYNTVDATLWYFEAIQQYGECSEDYETIKQELYPVLRDIVDWHLRGTRYGIHVDVDGLLLAGEPGVQLTWMDAKVGDWVVTPRIGKPVEIQALWYNALRTMEQFAERFGDGENQTKYREMAERANGSFGPLFWNDSERCFYDVVDRDGRGDPSIRPNQIFAISLPFALAEGGRAKAVVDRVEAELLTPYGLRSLSPHDVNYVGKYQGDARARDAAYHQGTVWPWLLGPFLTAYLKVHGRNQEILDRVRRWLEPSRQHLREAGLGSISEIFNGDPPHHPCGCIAQAWSVAELLRVLANVERNPGRGAKGLA